MKLLCILLSTFICGVLCMSVHPKGQRNVEVIDSAHQLLGAKMCSWGPSYWCSNITNAKGCSAVKHCIQSVWEHQVLPPDSDDVCNICKDMVQQARDQLESNMTQEELKQVFEGSCKLIPLQVVAKECCALADEFIPELVETLASQMNPQVVCSVAGLCNSARIDDMLQVAQEGGNETGTEDAMKSCKGCEIVVNQLRDRFDTMPRDDLLNNMLEVCGRFGSFSDGCSSIVITYFNNIYKHLNGNLQPDGVCHLAGVCSLKFHSHSQTGVEVVHESGVGVVSPDKEDLPCDLCQELVNHLRDILVANTTEGEFEQILQGICKQTGSFKDECLSIADQYFPEIYDFLVNELDGKEVCTVTGLCPAGLGVEHEGPIWPLLPANTVIPSREIDAGDQIVPWTSITPAEKIAGQNEANSYGSLHRVSISDNGATVKVFKAETLQLPISRLFPQTMLASGSKDLCIICEYVLHYLQDTLTTPSTEAEIKEAVDKVCKRLPSSIEAQCQGFVDTYGDAFVALVAQEIDPSQVCPRLGICPANQVFVDLNHPVQDKPTCPLCLMAVQALISKLKDNKTEDSIKEALDNLCTDLPQSLVKDCRDFVESYSEELIDMLIADFTPQEACIYLHLCDESLSSTAVRPLDITSNEIPPLPPMHSIPETGVGSELAAQPKELKDTTECVICEFVLSKIDSLLKDKTTEDEIKQAVHSVCNALPLTVTKECNDFVNQYADLIITLLAQSVDPKQLCTIIDLCGKSKTSLKNSFKECAVCEATLAGLDKLLEDPVVEQNIGQEIGKVCSYLPKQDYRKCKDIVTIYGPSIVNLLAHLTDSRMVCMKIGLCVAPRHSVALLGGKKCVWGPGYWCQSRAHAASCGAIQHCEENLWKKNKVITN